MSKFGNFNEAGSEYIITDLQTPRPMLNYIWNDRILSGVNHFGGGVGAYGMRASSYIDPDGKGRNVILKNGNRYFYIRDEETGEFWNPGWFPSKKELKEYKCTHGLGYTIIEGSYKGVHVTSKVFVNETDPVEIWTVSVKNNTSGIKKLKIYPFVEFSLSGYAVYCNYYATVYAKFHKENNLIVAHNKAIERPHEWYSGFIASSLPVTGFDTSSEKFFGPYNSSYEPEVIKNGSCHNSIAVGEDMIGVIENTFVLEAGQGVSYHVLIGAADTDATAIALVKKLLEPGKIEADFLVHVASRSKMIEDISIETPDSKVNNLVNKWIKQQVQLCAEAGRDTGKGFRDQLQDAWAIASFNPEMAKEKILETLKYQYKDGKCVRGWLPLDHHIYSDGPTWIAPTVNAYLKETGDYNFLNSVVPYLDQGEGTVLEHILTSVRYSSEDLGERNLVLAHAGDWNDSLNGIGVGGKGESVWTSIALYYALNNVAEMAKYILFDEELESEMHRRAVKIKTAINDTGWDGEWYLAGYTDEGHKVGSHMEEEGSIYLNSQTWAIMTGIAEGKRLEKCVQAIDNKLDSPYGPLTLFPTYTKYNKSIGRLSAFVPGIWENGTPYCHGGTFKIVADCVIGDGNAAYKSMLKILPDSEENPSDYSGCEPYALTNMYFGPDHPKAGQTMFAWVTGTAGWMFRAVTQYMMGFHPGYNYITINPCIPDDWTECSMKRMFRGDTYQLKIKNHTDSKHKVMKISVDGKPIDSDQVKIFHDGETHVIAVDFI